MNKYIDSEKLKTEIEKLSATEYGGNTLGDDVANCALDYVLEEIIPSLQQDETQVDKMLCSQVWWEEQGWIMIPPDATIEGIDSLLREVKKKLQQKQMMKEVDLEKEIIRYQREDMDRDTTVGDVARHFYELGRNTRKEES